MLETNLTRVALELAGKLQEVAHIAAEEIAEDAKTRVPVDTGELRDAIHTEETENGYAVVAGNRKVFYGHIVEHGSVKTPAHPFLVPALEDKRGQILEQMSAAIRRTI